MPGTRLPSPATARPDRAKVGQVFAAARAALGPTGPGPGPGRSKEAAETRSLWCSWVTRASNCPWGLSFPPDIVRRTTRAPARTGAGTAAAGTAQRPALGRATAGPEGRAPAPGRRSDLVSPHTAAPDSLTSRPLLPQRAAQPQPPSLPLTRPPEAIPSSCAPSRGGARPRKAGPAGGGASEGSAGWGRCTCGSRGRRHAHPRPRLSLSKPRGKADCAWRSLRPAWSHPPLVSASLALSAFSPEATSGRGLSCYSAPQLIGDCCPHP